MIDFIGPVITRTCKCCGDVKDLHEFKRALRNTYGRGHDCRDCDKARAKQWRLDNLETSRAMARRTYHNDPVAARARTLAWSKANPGRIKATAAVRRESGREAIRAYQKTWHERNSGAQRSYTEEVTQRRRAAKAVATAFDVPLPSTLREHLRRLKKDAYNSRWVERNRDKVSGYGHKYRKKHAERLAPILRQRRAKRMDSRWAEYAAAARKSSDKARAKRWLRRPAWVLYEDLHASVLDAARATAATGVKHEVDHFYPLVSEYVSGLDVPANRRVVTAGHNRRKSNKIPSTALIEFCEVPARAVYEEASNA